MLHVNFNAYANYVTDSLYQWDVNQDLVINGLGLSEAPEIHFANANMARAIVRNSSIDNGVVTVRIPNSLLQSALTIKAYIGVYEGAGYQSKGVYRPFPDCRMHTNAADCFCPVCQRAIARIIEFYTE